MEEEKIGWFKRIYRWTWSIVILIIPAIRLLSYNSRLRHCSRIVKNEPWFLKQRVRNYILSILLIIPLLLTFYRGYTIVDKDINFKDRIQEASQVSGLFNKPIAYYNTVAYEPSDTEREKAQKWDTQARLLAFSILISIGGGFSLVMGILVLNFHPITYNSKILKQLLVQNGVIRKEDEPHSLVFATPIGFLIDVKGSRARDLAQTDSIWAALNIRIKDFVEDPKKRSIVFFRKSYELQDTYLYDKIV